MQDAWRRGQPLTLHGYVYGLHNGLLNDLCIESNSPAALEAAYPAAMAALASRVRSA